MLDIDSNRKARKYSRKEQLARVLWSLMRPLFRCSPRVFFAWRCALLRLFGATIGREVHIYNSAIIYLPWNLVVGDWSSIGENVLIYNLGRVTIGSRVTVSHRAHICAGTHDYTQADLPLRKEPVTIGDQVWLCADCFIGPKTCIGEGSVVGAGSVVLHDVRPWMVVAGNPAREIKSRHIVENSAVQ